MSSLRIVFGIIWIVLVLVSHGIWTASAVSSAPAMAPQPHDTTSVSDLDVGPEAWPDSPPARRVDVYGNEVEDAITEYRIDVRGDLYERHAPQTALPRPKRPGA